MTTPSAHICAACARCCTIGPGEEELCFPLGRDDIARVEAAVADPPPGWLVESPNTEGFRAMLARLFPGREDSLQERFAESGVHLRLGVRDEGSCVFLGESGCVLPEEAKPVHCRLFPVWMRGRTVAIVDAECDLVARSRGTAALLAAIGLDRQELRRLFAAMRKGLDLGPGNGI